MKRTEYINWGVLVAAMVAIGVLYWRSPRTVRLPVIRESFGFQLTNQLGTPVTGAGLRGEILVVNVIFSTCPGLCQQLSTYFQTLQSRIPSGVKLLSLTSDPETDSPEVLARYGARFQADPKRWWFLTGPKSDVYRTATDGFAFSVVENPDPNAKLEDQFIHSSHWVVADRSGRIRAIVQSDEPGAISKTLDAIQVLMRER